MRPLPSLALVLSLSAPGCKSQPIPDSFELETHQRDATLTAMQPPRVSMAVALETAQRMLPTGRVVGAFVDTDGDTPKYRALVVDGDKLHVFWIDAWSGALLSDVRDDGNRVIVGIARRIQSHPERVAISFSRAIDVARGAIPGTWPASVVVHTDDDNVKYVYDVELVSRADVRSVEVHAADGTLGEIDQPESAQNRDKHAARSRQPFSITIEDALAADEMDLTEAPSISLVSAIELARRRAPDASFVHAELYLEDKRANCLICFWDRQSLHYMEINAENGELLLEETKHADAELSKKLQKGARRSDSSIEPAQAIAASIAAVPGSWARLIDLDCEADPLAYRVEVVAGDLVREVRIRAADGMLLCVTTPDAQSEDTGSDL